LKSKLEKEISEAMGLDGGFEVEGLLPFGLAVSERNGLVSNPGGAKYGSAW